MDSEDNQSHKQQAHRVKSVPVVNVNFRLRELAFRCSLGFQKLVSKAATTLLETNGDWWSLRFPSTFTCSSKPIDRLMSACAMSKNSRTSDRSGNVNNGEIWITMPDLWTKGAQTVDLNADKIWECFYSVKKRDVIMISCYGKKWWINKQTNNGIMVDNGGGGGRGGGFVSVTWHFTILFELNVVYHHWPKRTGTNRVTEHRRGGWGRVAPKRRAPAIPTPLVNFAWAPQAPG